MNDKALIIFVKNPEKGKVKTRLAASVGDDAALKIYKFLLSHTHAITNDFPAVCWVYYADRMVQGDLWDDGVYKKAEQNGYDLGARMENAFEEAFRNGYKKVCIIGSDCYELTQEVLLRAFEELEEADIVLGPSRDGGYYLLGMKKLHKPFFINKQWSTDSVAYETIKDITSLGLSYRLLPLLSDVDHVEDLETMPPEIINTFDN